MVTSFLMLINSIGKVAQSNIFLLRNQAGLAQFFLDECGVSSIFFLSLTGLAQIVQSFCTLFNWFCTYLLLAF